MKLSAGIHKSGDDSQRTIQNWTWSVTLARVISVCNWNDTPLDTIVCVRPTEVKVKVLAPALASSSIYLNPAPCSLSTFNKKRIRQPNSINRAHLWEDSRENALQDFDTVR